MRALEQSIISLSSLCFITLRISRLPHIVYNTRIISYKQSAAAVACGRWTAPICCWGIYIEQVEKSMLHIYHFSLIIIFFILIPFIRPYILLKIFLFSIRVYWPLWCASFRGILRVSASVRIIYHYCLSLSLSDWFSPVVYIHLYYLHRIFKFTILELYLRKQKIGIIINVFNVPINLKIFLFQEWIMFVIAFSWICSLPQRDFMSKSHVLIHKIFTYNNDIKKSHLYT